MRKVYISAFGQVVIPEPVRQRAFASALRKRLSAVEASKYANRLMARWAQGTAYLLWKNA